MFPPSRRSATILIVLTCVAHLATCATASQRLRRSVDQDSFVQLLRTKHEHESRHRMNDTRSSLTNTSPRRVKFTTESSSTSAKQRMLNETQSATSRSRELSATCSNHDACAYDEYCYGSGSTGYCYDCAACYRDNDSITGSCPSKCSYADPSSVGTCSNHDACPYNEYCYASGSTGYCYDCFACYIDNDSITGSCPSKCSYADPSSVGACSNHNACAYDEYCYISRYSSTGFCNNCAACHIFGNSITDACPNKCDYASSCGSSTLKSFLFENDYDGDYEDFGVTNEYTGSCGAFSTKSDQWCATDGPNTPATCHAFSEDDCCELNGGVVGGLVAGLVAGVAVIVTLILFCCKCCCFRPKNIVLSHHPIHGVPVQHQMQSPQVIVVPANASPQPAKQ